MSSIEKIAEGEYPQCYVSGMCTCKRQLLEGWGGTSSKIWSSEVLMPMGVRIRKVHDERSIRPMKLWCGGFCRKAVLIQGELAPPECIEII
jgi:hypothetical protein